MMVDNSYKTKFAEFKNAVLGNESHLFVIIADESHYAYNWGGAHDKFVNDADLLAAQNLIIVQVSATPYCNLTLNTGISVTSSKKFNLCHDKMM